MGSILMRLAARTCARIRMRSRTRVEETRVLPVVRSEPVFRQHKLYHVTTLVNRYTNAPVPFVAGLAL